MLNNQYKIKLFKVIDNRWGQFLGFHKLGIHNWTKFNDIYGSLCMWVVKRFGEQLIASKVVNARLGQINVILMLQQSWGVEFMGHEWYCYKPGSRWLGYKLKALIVIWILIFTERKSFNSIHIYQAFINPNYRINLISRLPSLISPTKIVAFSAMIETLNLCECISWCLCYFTVIYMNLGIHEFYTYESDLCSFSLWVEDEICPYYRRIIYVEAYVIKLCHRFKFLRLVSNLLDQGFKFSPGDYNCV